MPRAFPIAYLLRELCGRCELQRVPEPSEVMDDAEQVRDFAAAADVDSIISASHVFHAARASQVLQACSCVLDLGCGPATQLIRLAALNPQIQFIGVDLSSHMLEEGARRVARAGLRNVALLRDDVTALRHFEDASIDGVISTVTLHHLPTLEHLRACFAQIRRVLRPGGGLYLADFGRLKSEASVRFLAEHDKHNWPPRVAEDYECSLRAAFSRRDFATLTREHLCAATRVYSTFLVPGLVVIKSMDRVLPARLRQRLGEMRDALPPRHRRDLDDMRLFMRLGGMGRDPFPREKRASSKARVGHPLGAEVVSK